MNPQWSDEVKEQYIKDQAFYAECTARGIQICQDTATVKLAVRNKPWTDLPTIAILDIYQEVLKEWRGGHQVNGQIAFAKAIEAKIKEVNT